MRFEKGLIELYSIRRQSDDAERRRRHSHAERGNENTFTSPPGEPKAKHLEAAVKAALEGKKPDVAETSAASGCGIKFNPKRDE